MSMKEWLIEAAKASKKRTMPVLSFPVTSLLGITVEELIATPESQAKGMVAIAERCPSLASVSMMDLSVEAEAFGATPVFAPDEVPAITGILVEDEEAANALQVPAIGAGRTARNIEAIRLAKAAITDRPVLAGVIGPFSLAGRLVGVSELMIDCYEEEELVEAVMEKTTAFLIDYIKAYRDAGADGVVMAEPLTGVVSPMHAEAFSCPYVKRIIDEVQTDDFIVIYHNCGASTVRMLPALVEQGAAAYHFGNAVDMVEIMEKLPAGVIAMGNVDPVSAFKEGTPENMRHVVYDLLRKLGSNPDFIISSGCDIPPLAPWDNIDAYFKAVSDFYEGKAE